MGRLWKSLAVPRKVLSSERRDSHRLCRGVENPHLDREFWEYEMPEQANVHQITTPGFPPPLSRYGGARRLLRGDPSSVVKVQMAFRMIPSRIDKKGGG